MRRQRVKWVERKENFRERKQQMARRRQQRKWPLSEHSQEWSVTKQVSQGQDLFLEGNEILIVLGLEACEKLFDLAQA